MGRSFADPYRTVDFGLSARAMSIRIALASKLLSSEQNKLPDAMKMLSSAP